MFIFFYCFFFPVGLGLSYWPPVICSWEYFPEKKGMITGLIIGAFGLGAFFFGFITNAIVNPDNLKPPKGEVFYPIEVAERVPRMF